MPFIKLTDSAIIRLLKILDIFIIGNVYLGLGVVASSAIYKYVSKPYDPKKSKIRNFLQLILETGIIMVSVYLIRIFVKHVVPNPFEGIHGFDSHRVMENNGGVILAFAFLLYMKETIKSKVDAFYDFFHAGSS